MDSEEHDYNQFIEERKILLQSHQTSSQSFDKAILTVASGSFGFTIAFLKELVPNPISETKWLLHFSWILFALSILIILISFLTSQKACLRQIEISYEVIVNKTKTLKNWWSLITTILNYISVIVLTMAFIFWAFFMKFNY